MRLDVVLVLFVFILAYSSVLSIFDFELNHNLTAERLEAAGKRSGSSNKRTTSENQYAVPGFGRILTWNVKQLGYCSKDDNVNAVKDATCVILQTANVIALQNAENLDLSCLPCSKELKQDYEWPGQGNNEELKLLIRTKQYRTFSVKRLEQCANLSVGSVDNNVSSIRSDIYAYKRDMFGNRREISTVLKKNVHYVIVTVRSDLNNGATFLIANVRMPLDRTLRRPCINKLVKDIQAVQEEDNLQHAKIFIVGDLRIDQLEGADSEGDLSKLIKSLTINNDNMNLAIKYIDRDPFTTLSGRRFDNILTNIPIAGLPGMIGPDLPIGPNAVNIPLPLQRLYNNYMVSLYTTTDGSADSVYECIKAYQMAGKNELAFDVCKDTWVPTHYISSYLPHSIDINMQIRGKSIALPVRIAFWNIEGGNLKDRLLDPKVHEKFLRYLQQKDVVVFSQFPPDDRILDEKELKSSSIDRLRQGDITTEYGIFVNAYAKDGDTDMYIMKKSDGDQKNDDKLDGNTVVTMVALLAPKLVLDSVKLQPCLYMLTLASDEENIEKDISKLMKAIEKDVKNREECDFKFMFASLNVTDSFDLSHILYKSYKFSVMPCPVQGGASKPRFTRTDSNGLIDFVVLLDKGAGVEVGNCTMELPGDELARGLNVVSDFRELSTHYPLSILLKHRV